MAVRVLIADDSLVMRLMVKDLLNQDPEIEVVDSVKNGKEAYIRTIELEPDVVVLDMLMGAYDGTYAVKEIMSEKPTPIIVLSALGNTNLQAVLDTMKYGAFDYVNKPQDNNTRIKDVGSELIRKIKAAAETTPTKLDKLKVDDTLEVQHLAHTFESDLRYELVVIGASTGGPSAVQTVISKLPANFNLPVVVVQHMPDNFISAFAERLNDCTPLTVLAGKNGMLLEPGKIYITRSNQNTRIVMKGGNAMLDHDKVSYMEYNNPSINGVMMSAAKSLGSKVIGVVLTGMGRDGAKGIQAIKGNKGLTIAQNEATSVVYGMPREAAATGCVDAVMKITDVAGYIVSSLD